jgi:O-antigen/teichoic acid export membrane protein
MTVELPLPGSNVPSPTGDWKKKELALAAANAAKLGSSLIVTWGIGLAARLYIPRFLGPDRFGMLNFAEAFTATAFVLIDLGVDTYVRKEISVHPERASEFVGGIVMLRSLLSLLIFVGMGLVLHATHSSAEARTLVYIYGFMQFFMIGNNTSAGLLQAVGRVNEMSVLSIVIKLVWAACLASAILFHLGLWAFALTYALAEALKSVVLFRLARRHVGFGMNLQVRATGIVVVAALPFFISGLASKIYDKVGASILSFMTSDREVGWYGAAGSLVGLTMLLAPLVGWVVIPLFARSAAKSKDEFFSMVRRSLEFVLSLSIPASLGIMLGAEYWVSIVFGRAYAPAVISVQILAVATVLMYVSIIAFNALAVLNYTWRMSMVAVGGMFISPLCNWLLIPWMRARLGPGGGAAGSSMATFLTEVGIVVPLFWLLGRRGYDRRLIVSSLKNIGCAILVVVMHVLLPASLGPIRIVIDAVVYTAIAIAVGGIDIQQLIRLAKMRTSLKSAD